MSKNRIRIFISSSSEAKNWADELARGLRAHQEFDATAWSDEGVFPPAEYFAERFEQQLDKNDFFVVLFTPDVQAPGAEVNWYTRANVILEAGAAWGRHGRSRLIIFKDDTSPPPSNLGTTNVITFHSRLANPGERAAEIEMMVNAIRSKIKVVTGEFAQLEPHGRMKKSDGKSRWLVFMQADPNMQDQVVLDLRSAEESAWNDYKAVYERAGVVWGSPDAFLLFNAPTNSHAAEFIKSIRSRFHETVKDIDSRFVWANSYWSNPDRLDPAKYAKSGLILFSCHVAQVEYTFKYIVETAMGRPSTSRNRVSHAGILMGADDLFCIVDGKSTDDLNKFTLESLKELSRQKRLKRNTTTLLITDPGKVN
ncbi:MAG: nucleotide-binding protein [Candidatus Hydrogenedentes bacterium]|nr:nucleotide-binding protein [Candidatus Hydrogenedentota bacterium]